VTLTQRIFALKRTPGFDQLPDDELLVVAASMTERRYAPDEVVLAAGVSIWQLLVVVGGRVTGGPSGEDVPSIVGADLLILNRPVPHTLTADSREGAVCLRMSKGHFFTVVNECPALLVAIARLHAGPRLQEQP
jgi:CRP-like cAMP-binding protein